MCNCESTMHPGTQCSSAGCHCHECPTCQREHDRQEWRSLGSVCARCNQHTGNNSQGHFWSMCQARWSKGGTLKDAIREPHFCCPGDCELEQSPDERGMA